MRGRTGMLTATGLLLAACSPQMPDPDPAGRTPEASVPAAVAAIAAPGQELTTARKFPDGCYWYDHVGPVETTPLPLRTADGRPICGAPPT